MREIPEFVPAKLKIVRYIQPTYCCPCCKKKGIVRIAKYPVPKPLPNHSMASDSVVAEVMYQKYVQAVPLYRQETQWKDVGIAFSRTTMANWVIRCSQDWLSLVYDRMRKELLGREVLHADETPIQVLKGPGETAANKSYMWVYRTGKDGLPPVVLFEYQPGRNAENTPKNSWRDSPATCTRTATPGTTRWSILPGADAGRICAESSWTPCRQHLPILWERPVRPKLAGTTATGCSRLKKIELLPEKDQQRVNG